jgi:hypothetical protein
MEAELARRDHREADVDPRNRLGVGVEVHLSAGAALIDACGEMCRSACASAPRSAGLCFDRRRARRG